MNAHDDRFRSVLSVSSVAILLILFILSVTPVAGQTVAEIEKAYGKPTLAYSVTERIWMTPDFAADGQVCQMRFYPKRVSGNTAYLGGRLNAAELKWILNNIVPPSARGKVKSPLGLADIGGGLAEAKYEYEKVTFTFANSFKLSIDPEALKNSRLIGIDFPIPDAELPKPTPTPASESDFDRGVSPEIVILRWNDRTCAQDANARSNEPRVAEIEQRFGQPQKIYSVGSFISMTPGFAADGQVCQMWLFPKRVSGTNNYLGTSLEFNALRSFLNALVPPEQRGLQQVENFSTTATGGGLAWTTYPYENVSFTFWAGGRVSKSTSAEPLLRRGEFTFTIPYSPEPVIKDRQPSRNDFRPTENTEIVNVRWQRGTCVSL